MPNQARRHVSITTYDCCCPDLLNSRGFFKAFPDVNLVVPAMSVYHWRACVGATNGIQVWLPKL
ncbi:hypothetical protein PISMIDRAFT_685694 [Pisolithus microcarpus 441]|uniref:Uncharacterized protein n=1 Tax=Pisolithus microcarpus 441 TaxID=765257 RepID=A0A0C9YSU2_9AGAM|nr:hypothetical protein PISMIDRAFT_685694 [Pisolithus microcarpus 441]